jgi:hypothetical protein
MCESAQLDEIKSMLAEVLRRLGDRPAAERDGAFRHSEDFRSVYVGGRTYTFGPAQAHCVKLLHQAHENGTPDMCADYLLEQAECESSRLGHLFRHHPAWRTLIVFGPIRGTYRLNLPARV